MDIDLTPLGLSDRLLRGMANAGLQGPTTFQARLFRFSVEGKNVLALVPPPHEVVAAVVLPALQQCTLSEATRTDRSPRSLIITSSRDRARSLQRGALSFGKFLSLRAVALYGGVTVESQIPLIQQGAEILIATPDRLLEHLQRGSVTLSVLRFLVVDEADRMIEEGALQSFGEILKHIPETRCKFIFASRKTDGLNEFAASLLGEAEEIESEGEGKENPQAGASAGQRHPKRDGRVHPAARKGSPRGTPARHAHPHRGQGSNQPGGTSRHTGNSRHAGHSRQDGGPGQGGNTRHAGLSRGTGTARPTKQTGYQSHTGPGRPAGQGKHTGQPKHSGGVTGSGHPKHQIHPTKGKKRTRRQTPTTLTAPRKKRPPKKLDSFSSDSGGAGWSSY